MEHIENSVVTSVLTDAFTRYLRYLELEQELHETSQPRQGKGIETTADLARTEYFRSRTAITQSCLLVVGKVAEAVRRSIAEEDSGDVKDVDRGKGKAKWIELERKDDDLIDFNEDFPSFPQNLLQTIWEEGDGDDDEAYINPMTGQWIYPVTSKSAGPSGTQELHDTPTRKPSLTKKKQTEPMPILLPVDKEEEKSLPSIISDAGKPTKPEVKLNPISRSNPKSISRSDLKSIPKFDFESFSRSDSRSDSKSSFKPEAKSKPDVNLTPAFSIDLLDLDDEDLPPYEALVPAPELHPTNPFANPVPSYRSASSAPSFDTPETTPSDTDSEQGEIPLNRREEPTFSFAVITPSQFELDRLAAQKLQAQLDEETETEFQRLQEEWAKQDRILAEQNAFAQEMRRVEEARDDAIRVDQAAARALQEQWEQARDNAIRMDQAAARALQEQWEQEVRAEEDSTRRLIEQLKREAEEDMDRMKTAAKEAKKLAEQWEREEEERKRLIEEERRRRQADCVVCMDPSDKVDMCLLSCKHYYCGTCIAGAFSSALTSRKPFTCCSRAVPASIASRFLPATSVTQHDLLVLELSTPNPRYCSQLSCRRFIPPHGVHGPIATCPTCRTRTCALCNNAEHAGVCPEDRVGAAVIALARNKGWKSCPRCKAILEKTEGCLHMTCRCGAQWCYSCLRDWGTCKSTCARV